MAGPAITIPLDLFESLREAAVYLLELSEWRKGEPAGNAEVYDELKSLVERARAVTIDSRSESGKDYK